MSLPANFDDYRALARSRLPRVLFDYIDGGAGDESAMHASVNSVRTVELPQRVLRDVSSISLRTELFGQTLDMPVVLGPVGMAGMFARRGELQAHKAALSAGVTSCLSTLSVCSIEEVSEHSEAAPWFQLYMIKDRGYMRNLLQRAQVAGCTTLVFTVDVSVPGIRYRDIRAGRAGQLSFWGNIRRAFDGVSHPAWLWDVMAVGRPHDFGNIAAALPQGRSSSDYFSWVRQSFDASVTWSDIDWIRQHWRGSIVLKGILHAEDAKLAAAAGVNGIVVSNHGGRQLAAATPPIKALPGVVEAVEGKCKVLMDGGVRGGLDVLRCLAQGADGVMLGRAWAMALAARGESGVAHMLKIIRDELSVSMALAGCTDVTAANQLLRSSSSRPIAEEKA